MTAITNDFDNNEIDCAVNGISYDSDFEEFDESLYEPLPWNTPIELDLPSLINILPNDVTSNEGRFPYSTNKFSTSNVELSYADNFITPYQHMDINTVPYHSNINSRNSGDIHANLYASSSYYGSIWNSLNYPEIHPSPSYPSVVESEIILSDFNVPVSPISNVSLDLEKISTFNRKRDFDHLQNSVMVSRKTNDSISTANQNMFYVSNVSSNKTAPMKSKRQPRPKLFVLPRSTGPIHELNPHDVLSGRGGRVNANSGNIVFREIVAQYKSKYIDTNTRKLEKAHIAADIVYMIRIKGGRFLTEDDFYPGTWYEIGDARAIRKAGQALREDPSHSIIVNGLSNDDSDSQSSS